MDILFPAPVTLALVLVLAPRIREEGGKAGLPYVGVGLDGDEGGDLAVSVEEMVFAELARDLLAVGMMRDDGRGGRLGVVRAPLLLEGDSSPSDMSLAVAVCGETVAIELPVGESDWNASVRVGTICAPPSGLDFGGIGKCIFGGSIGLREGVGLATGILFSLLFVLRSGSDITVSSSLSFL